MNHPAIPIDPDIRTWILIPVVAMTLMTTLLRQALSMLMQSSASASATPSPMPMMGKPTMADLYTNNTVAASKLTRLAATSFTPSSLLIRQRYYLGNDEDGKLCSPPEATQNPLQAMMNQDPTAMAGMMKYNFAFLILNGGLMYLISYLFSESIAGKLPFVLTPTFKPIVQRGIDFPDLDASYVSALSWYFLFLFCSGSFTFLINKGMSKFITTAMPTDTLATADPMLAMAMSGSQPTSGFGATDPAKIFGQEADNWKILPQPSFLPDVEAQALKALSTI